MNDPIIPDVDEQGQVISRLDSAQQFAAQRSPDDAADTVNYAKKAGLDFATAESVKQKAPLPKAEGWGALVKDHPVLSQHLSEPAFAAMAQDDTHTLSAFERLFGGWDEMAWRSKMALQDDARSQELAAIGRAQRYGTATKEQLARGEELEKESAAQKPEIGFVPGIVPAVVGMIPGLKRASNVAGAYAMGGAAAGALTGAVAAGAPTAGLGAPVGAIPGAIAGAVTMGGAGFVVGMAQDTASTEQGLAYREYVKMPGATPESAAVAADIVALANGGLQAIPAEKILNLVPGLKGLIAGKATRDVMRTILGSNTGRAAMARFAGRVAESGLLMALIGGGQELVRETGAIGATTNDEGQTSQTYHGDKILSSMASGAQQGLGFGLAHAVAPGISDYREAKIGEARGEMYKAIGQLSANSKLRERMPEAFKGYANEVIAKYGKVSEVKAPAEQLAALFQKEGIDETKIQETMPEVAKQLRESGPKDEVIIPMADLATNIAPLKSFPELANDLRVGDELTPREAKKVQADVDQMMKDAEKAKAAPEPEQATPERRVYDDVFKKLTDAGQDPGVAQHDAALWAAFSKARGDRLGIDPFEYFKKRDVQIGAELPNGDVTLGQPLSDFMGITREQFLGKPKITSAANARELKPSAGKSLEGAPLEDFLGGKYKAKFGDKGAAVFDADGNVIASYDWLGGNTLVVAKKYRRQGIGEELAYQARVRNPEMPIAETRTRASQKLQTRVWDRIQRELARSVIPEKVSSEQFKKWFEGSKVVNEAGAPKTVYHGTSSGGFEFFDSSRQDKSALYGPGFYFTEDPSVASGYTEKAEGTAPAVYPVHLSLKNPFKVDSTAAELLPRLKKFRAEAPPPEIKRMIDASFREDSSIASPEGSGSWADNTEWAYKILDKMGMNGEEAFAPYFDYFIEHAVKMLERDVKEGHIPKGEEFGQEAIKFIERNVYASSDSSMGASNIREVLEKLGFDGITHVGGNLAGGGEKQHRVWIAFQPEQVKSLFNRGNYDPNNPNVLLQSEEAKLAAGIEEFGPELQKALVSGADIPEDKLDAFLAEEKKRQPLKFPSDEEIKAAIAKAQEFYQRGGAAGTEGYRGKISFDQARSFLRITLTGKANLSTFLHESGHAFLEFMRMDAEGGHAQSKEDLAKAFEWMGVKPGEAPNTEQLEAFARGFEAYLLEGKAPAPGLRGMFHEFAGWLKLVYRSVAGLGVKLNDDIRGVMDRMLASDKEIEQARQGLGLQPMKKPEGMTDAEYAKYTERFGKAMQAGRDALEAQALREFGQMLGAHRDAVRGEVEEATKLDPVHNAYEALRTGKRLDGGEIAEEVRGKKLDREAVREAGYKGVKWSSITSEGGLDPEIAAPYYGFKDGPEMLSKLEARQSRTREIKEETDRRMMELYPNADIAKMSAEAVKALHLDDVGNVLWLEAQAVGKRIGKEDPRTAKAVLKEVAKRRTEGMTALEMQPGRFARAEERSAMEWTEALKKKDFEGAHKAKLEQILNHEMWKQVADAKEEVDSIRNYLAKFEELPTRRRIGKAGQIYLEAIDKITDDIELKRTSGKEIGRRAALESYLKKMEDEDGATITIPEELRSEASLKNYKQMTLEDLRAVHDAVRNIESMARLKNKIFDGREHRNFHETAVRAAEEVRANLGAPYAEKPGSPQNPGWFDKKKAAFRESRAEKKMIEFVAREFDGGKTAGKMHDLLFQPFATADAKKHVLTEKITDELLKPLRDMTFKERLALDKTVDFLGTPMKMRDVIAVALNMGNDGNKRKLIDGYGYRGWSEEKIVGRLGELLTDKHLDLIQHFWKTIGMLWPEIKALSERTTGLAPPKVEASKLTIRGREMEGGYYPIVYDRERSYKAEQIAQRKGDLFENNFLKPGVSKGFTEARTQFAAPILLSLNVIPAHIHEVVHYLTHYEPVRAVDRLLAHSELRTAITEGAGREVYNLFRPWLQRIAHEGSTGMEHLTTLDKVLRNLRVGNTLNRFGFKITAALMQSFNLLSAMKELGGTISGTKYMALGMRKWMGDVESFRDPFGAVYDASPEIRGKSIRIERELLSNFDHFTSAFSEFGHLKEQLGHFSMSFFTLVLRTADTLTWYAAREKAFEESHPRPEEYADSVVRLSQMGEGVKDKAAIMFGGEGTKLFTGMYSWYSVVYNQLTEKQPQNRSTGKKIAENASRWWWMVIAPTVMMGVVKGKGPKKDKDDPLEIAKFYGEEMLMEATKPWPLLGAATETVLTEHDARWGTWITTAIKGIRARAKLVKGEPLSEREKTDMVRSTGILGRLPADALWNAYKYVSAVQDGKLEEPIRDLLFRSPGEWK